MQGHENGKYIVVCVGSMATYPRLSHVTQSPYQYPIVLTTNTKGFAEIGVLVDARQVGGRTSLGKHNHPEGFFV